MVKDADLKEDDAHHGLLQSPSEDYHDGTAASPNANFAISNSSVSPAPHPRHRQSYQRLGSYQGDLNGGLERPRGLAILGDRKLFTNTSSLAEDEREYRHASKGSTKSIPPSFIRPLQDTNGHSWHNDNTHGSDCPGATFPQRNASCASRENIWRGAADYVYITLLVLSVFSTVFSAIYLCIAIIRPQYSGKQISDSGHLTYKNAQTIFTLIARLIELSFVAVFVAFIGQVVSRRAFNKSRGYGVTLADISIRGWVMQPGQILTHPAAFRRAIGSLIGLLAFVAAVSAMLYTTAVTALVTPQLIFSPFTEKIMQGEVTRSFGDTQGLLESCASPIRHDNKGWQTKQQTCMGPQVAAEAYNDWSKWLELWTTFANTSKTAGSSDLNFRVPGYSLIDQRTVVTAPWIEVANMTETSDAFDRIVNNVSLALPHAGIIDAAVHPVNNIVQPERNDEFGSYNIHASVLSPALNVICTEMSAHELEPLVYEKWPHADKTLPWDKWNNEYAGRREYVPSASAHEWLNRTKVDQIFGWGPEFGERRPPVFPVLPTAYNTLTNASGTYAPVRNRDAVYVLGGNPKVSNPNEEKNGAILRSYSLCAIRAYRTADCSTWYENDSSSGKMFAECGTSKEESFRYEATANKSDLKYGAETTGVVWVDLADQVVTAIALNDGIVNASAANARLLTQLFPTTRSLDPLQPSMAEALAIIASSSLLLGSRNASLLDMTDAAQPKSGTMQSFRARIRTQQYASGATQRYQNLFFIVLFTVLAGNVLVLGWLIRNRGLVTDFSDPANMFALSINSPPSDLFAGSCGCGPVGKQYGVRWHINVDDDHVYMESDEREIEMAEARAKFKSSPYTPTAPDSKATPIMQSYEWLSSTKSLL